MPGTPTASNLEPLPDAEALLDKGLVQYAIGNQEAAVRCWREAFELDPGSARAHDYLHTVGAAESAPHQSVGEETKTEAMPSFSEAGLSVAPDVQSDSLAPPFAREVTFDEESVATDDLEIESEPVVPDVEIMLRDARSAEASGRFEEALKSAEDALKRDPEREETQGLVRSLRERLKQEYLAALKPLERIPVLRATDASILELSLDPIGGFLISQIDGEITIEELLTILGTFDEFRVLGSLHFFLTSGIIELR